MNPTFTVGITGGVGSGKSAVTSRLEHLGVTVVDADIVAREVVAPGSDALASIARHFGEDILSEDGSLNRSALRSIVFHNAAQRRWLEELTHPLIGRSIRKQLWETDSSYVVLSSPLLLETSQREFVDHVVVVDIPEALQLERTVARDNNSEELVRAIMAAQMERQPRLAFADSVIDNSGDLQALDTQVNQLHERLLAQAQKH
jgi:dephospho-CoA kinase